MDSFSAGTPVSARAFVRVEATVHRFAVECLAAEGASIDASIRNANPRRGCFVAPPGRPRANQNHAHGGEVLLDRGLGSLLDELGLPCRIRCPRYGTVPRSIRNRLNPQIPSASDSNKINNFRTPAIPAQTRSPKIKIFFIAPNPFILKHFQPTHPTPPPPFHPSTPLTLVYRQTVGGLQPLQDLHNVIFFNIFRCRNRTSHHHTGPHPSHQPAW